MKKLKNKILRKELRAFREYYSYYERYLEPRGLYPQFPPTPCLDRHGFQIDCVEGGKAYLFYPDGKKVKVVDIHDSVKKQKQ